MTWALLLTLKLAVSVVIFGQVVSADLQVTKLETPGGK